MVVRSALLSKVLGISHAFGSRDENIAAEFLPAWEARKVAWKQVHGNAVAEALAPGDACGEVDALFTRKPELPIAVVTADCVPILLARKDGGAVAAVHAGWRGTHSRILRALWDRLSTEGESPKEWVAAIGPSIGPCCYEVSEELAADFLKTFGRDAVPSFRRLDLPHVNEAELRHLGLTQVELIRACTQCSAGSQGPLFHSYRREGGGTRQCSVIQRHPLATSSVLK